MVWWFSKYRDEEKINDFSFLIKYPLNKIKKLHDIKLLNSKKLVAETPSSIANNGFKDLPYKDKLDIVPLSNFMEVARVLYKVYDLTKNSKTFEEYIKKSKDLPFIDVKLFGIPGMKFYDFNQPLEKKLYSYLVFYVVAKWLKLKPNKEFEPLFVKISKLLKDKKWW